MLVQFPKRALPDTDNVGLLERRMSYALDRTMMQNWLNRQHTVTRGQDRVHIVSIGVAHLKPGRRCILEYVCERKSADIIYRETFLGKINLRLTGEPMYNLMRSLWDSGFNPGNDDDILVARPIGVVTECGMWLQQKVAGESVANLIRQNPADRHLATRIAEAALKIKHCAVPAAHTHDIAYEMQILDNRLTRVIALLPELKNDLRSMLLQAYRMKRKLRGYPLESSHRDFYPEQILVSGDKLTLLDFDLYCRADIALDVANFTAHLTEEAIRCHGDPNHFSVIEDTIVSSYLAKYDVNLLRDIRIYYVLTLLRHIFICTLFKDRRSVLPELMGYCDQLLAENYVDRHV